MKFKLKLKLKAYSNVFFYHRGVQQGDRSVPPSYKAMKDKKAVLYAYNHGAVDQG